MRINTNIASLTAQRNLTQTTKALSRALERLSTGRRINRAGDDSAGLGISERLKSEVGGYKRAALNMNEAFGYLQTADGALAVQTEIVQRMRELAVQSSNGTLSITDRDYLDTEFQSLLREFQRTADQSTFNSTHLLDGSLEEFNLQVGVNKGQTIGVSLSESSTDTTFVEQHSEGYGTFSGPMTTLGFAGSVGAADLNGDGNVDLYSVNSASTAYLDIALGNGDGTFDSVESYDLGNSSFGITGLPVDVNDDGYLDFFVTNNSNGQVKVVMGHSDGSYTISQTLSTSGGSFLASPRLKHMDLNGDGSEDFFTISNYGGSPNSLHVYLNDGEGNFTNSATVTLGASDYLYDEFDLNADGNIDFVYQDLSGNFGIRLGNDNGSYTTAATIAAGAGYYLCGASDFNNDGILDLVANNGTNAKTYTGNTSGGYSLASTIATANGYGCIFGDFNQDGNGDFLAQNSTTYAVAVRLGDGTGNFNTGTTFTMNGDFLLDVDHKFAGDFNGDGNLDVASGDGTNIAVRLGTSTGTFTTGTTIASSSSTNMFVVDMNNDSIDDLYCNDGDTARTFLGGSSGLVRGGTTTFAGGYLLGSPADFDNDEVLDVLGYDAATSAVLYLQNSQVLEEAASLSLSTQEGSSDALAVLDLALEKLNERRASIGAVMNRLESAEANNATLTENLSASMSQVANTDVAEETAELTKYQILQQSGIGVLANANVSLQVAVSLLNR